MRSKNPFSPALSICPSLAFSPAILSCGSNKSLYMHGRLFTFIVNDNNNQLITIGLAHPPSPFPRPPVPRPPPALLPCHASHLLGLSLSPGGLRRGGRGAEDHDCSLARSALRCVAHGPKQPKSLGYDFPEKMDHQVFRCLAPIMSLVGALPCT